MIVFNKVTERLSLSPKKAPFGAVALIPIFLSAICFPFTHSLHERAWYVLAVLFFLCFFFFSAALLLSLYSLAAERSKLFGILGIATVALTLWFEPATRYFLTPMSFYLPLGALVAATAWGIRAWSRKHRFSSDE